MATIIVFSKDRPMQLHAYLESLFKYSDVNAKDIFVIYRKTNDTEYDKVKCLFPINWIEEVNFHEDLLKVLNTADEHVMFGCDDVVFTGNFSLSFISSYLNKNDDCFGFSLRLGKNIKCKEKNLSDNSKILKWNWVNARSLHYNYPWELDCTVYRKNDILDIINKYGKKFKSPNYLESEIAINVHDYVKKMNLSCYKEKSKAIVITVNIVQNTHNNPIDSSLLTNIITLNKLYNYKNNTLDIDKISRKKNSIIHVDAKYFILRKKVNLSKKEPNKLITLYENIKYLRKINLKENFNNLLPLKYHVLKNLRNVYSIPKIIDYDNTIELLINQNVSMARFGDGEYLLINNENIPFQKASKKLQKRLIEVLTSKNENLLIGIPKIYYDFNIENLKSHIRLYIASCVDKNYDLLNKYIDANKVYIPTEITQMYQIYDKYKFGEYFEKIKNIWKDKDITIICGETVFDKIKYNIFDCAKSVEYVYAPSKNAFDVYDNILENVKQIDKNRLILAILGPTATVLAHDLCTCGYRILDFGHIAKDYDAYKKIQNNEFIDLRYFFAPD